MRGFTKKENGISLIILTLSVIILIVITNVLIYKAKDSVEIKKIKNLYSDINNLREKIIEYDNQYGTIPAKIKYNNTSNLQQISDAGVLSDEDNQGDFYIIDLSALQGLTLNYGEEYKSVKDETTDYAGDKTDIYIINKNTYNIFNVEGVEIKQDNTTKTYYTDYTEPDNTHIDLRYIDGILIPDGYFYIGKASEQIVISIDSTESVNNDNNSNQYVWQEQENTITCLSDIEGEGISLQGEQQEKDFVESVNNYKGYFKNKDGNVEYVIITNKWSTTYTTEKKYKDSKGDTVVIPSGFNVSMLSSENKVENGFVIKDENNNEWVWVEVPQYIFKTAENETDYDNIKADLITYAKDYQKGSTNQTYTSDDKWYDSTGADETTSTNLNDTAGCGLTYSDYNTKYQTMLSSIYTNGGFWIGRYETGIEGTTAVIKKDVNPYTNVTCSEAQGFASQIAPEGKTTSLMFGIQWDLVCKIIESKKQTTTNGTLINKDLIMNDSTEWGNYSNSTFNVIRGKYSINIGETWTEISSSGYTKPTTENVLLTTGASERNKVLNIYDFAGNTYEFTLENTNATSEPVSLRGGSSGNQGNIEACCNILQKGTQVYSGLYGFRTAMY